MICLFWIPRVCASARSPLAPPGTAFDCSASSPCLQRPGNARSQILNQLHKISLLFNHTTCFALASRFPLETRFPREAFSVVCDEFGQSQWLRWWSTCGLPSSFRVAAAWWLGSPCGYWENCRHQCSAFVPWKCVWQCRSAGTRRSRIWFLCLNNFSVIYMFHSSSKCCACFGFGELGNFVVVNPRLHNMGPSSSIVWGTRPSIAHMIDLTARFLYLTRPRGKSLPKSR